MILLIEYEIVDIASMHPMPCWIWMKLAELAVILPCPNNVPTNKNSNQYHNMRIPFLVITCLLPNFVV